jgi:hypothetical protein
MKHIYYILMLAIPVSCTVSEKNIVGKYADTKRIDTLTMLADHTFEYKLKQNNGEFGWNNGSWAVSGRFLSFYDTKPVPIVGCKLKKKITGNTDDALRLIFKLTTPHKRIEISSVQIFNEGNLIDALNYKIQSNQVIITTAAFDSIAVTIPYFPILTFAKSRLELQKIYEILITPNDRLYELDKVNFKFRKKSFSNGVQKIKFKKIS